MGIKLGNGKWATKEDELLAYRVIEGKYFDRSFDFARSSTTTRVNKDGYIEDVPSDTARIDFADSVDGALLTEPASTNLITYPKSFGNSYWIKSRSSVELMEVATVLEDDCSSDNTANWTVNDCTLTFDTDHYVIDYVAATQNIYRDDLTLTEGNLYKVSFKAKQGTGGGVMAQGQLSESLGHSSSAGYISYSIPTDWEEYTFLAKALSNTDQITFYAKMLSGTYFIKDISIKEVQGFEAPKVDGNGDLERDAYKLVEDTSSGEHSVASSVITVTGSADHYQSLFIKTAERTKIGLREAQNSGKYATFDLLNEVVMDENGLTAHISKLAGGWYRIDYGCNSNVWTTMKMKVHLLDDTYTTGSPSSHSYTGDGTSGIYIAYAQLEEQASATSLMLPTSEGSTTSRVADACNGSGTAQDFKDYNASGVLYAEIAALSDDGTSRYISLSGSGTSNSIVLRYISSDRVLGSLQKGGAGQAEIIHTLTDMTDVHKVAFRWYGDTTTASNGRFSLWIDGVMVESEDVSGLTFPPLTLTELNFDRGDGVGNFYGKTRALEVLPYMSDAEMETLTT